jgi:hypothetical protein
MRSWWCCAGEQDAKTKGTVCASCVRYWLNQTFVMPLKMPVAALWKWWPARYSFVVCFCIYVVLAAGLPTITFRQTVYELNENINFKFLLWHLLNVFACAFICFVCMEWWKETLDNPDHPANVSRRLAGVDVYNGDGTTAHVFSNDPTTTRRSTMAQEDGNIGGSGGGGDDDDVDELHDLPAYTEDGK